MSGSTIPTLAFMLRADAQLVEHMCEVRPGLRPEQAHVALQALRTLPWALHPIGLACQGHAPESTACQARTEGLFGARLACVQRAGHEGESDGWHLDSSGAQWKAREG